MVTRKDVAALAGVSPTSVSYYINSNGYVSDEKGKKIRKAIEQLNYRPNLIAKSLRIRTTNQLVMICNEIRNSFHSELVHQTTKLAYQKGYTMLFSTIIDDTDYIEKICSYQVSGVFVISNKVSPEQINRIADLNIPTVILTNMEWTGLNDKVSEIKIGAYRAMRDLVNYVVSKGHTRLAYISNCPSEKFKLIDNKTLGFLDEIKANNLDPGNIIYNVTSASMAYQVVMDNYNSTERPTAYLCGNDTAAVGVLSAINEMGLAVPRDVVVTGFDNSENSRLSIPPLTTVDISTGQLSATAIDIMLDKIAGKPGKDVVIEPKLIIRKSTE